MPTTVLETSLLPGKAGEGNRSTASRSATYRYLVRFSDDAAIPYDAETSSGIPSYGFELISPVSGTHTKMFVTKKTAKQDEKDGCLYWVEVEFETRNPNSQELPPVEDDWTSGDKLQVTVSARSIPWSEEQQIDKNGKPICNSLNEPIHGIELTKYDTQIDASFYSDVLFKTLLDDTIGHVNDADCTIPVGSSSMTCAAGTLYFSEYTFETRYDEDSDKWLHITYSFINRPDGFQSRVPNMSCYSSSSGLLFPITDRFGQPVSEPRYIRTDGSVIASSSSATMLSFDLIPSYDFSVLLDQISA